MRMASQIMQQLDSEMELLGKGKSSPDTVNALANAAGKITSMMSIGMKYATQTKRRPKIDALDCLCTPKNQVE